MTKHSELTTLWPAGTLNKLASQATYELPTSGADLKKDKITLPTVVAKENNRRSIVPVQKAGRVTEKAKKREAAEDVAHKDKGNKEGSGYQGNRGVTREAKRARVAPRRSERARK